MNINTLAKIPNQKLLIIKNGGGQNSLKRIIAFFGFLFMSIAFCLAAFKGRITAEMFLTFPLGLVILYAPSLAVTLLKVWKGQTEEHGGIGNG